MDFFLPFLVTIRTYCSPSATYCVSFACVSCGGTNCQNLQKVGANQVAKKRELVTNSGIKMVKLDSGYFIFRGPFQNNLHLGLVGFISKPSKPHQPPHHTNTFGWEGETNPPWDGNFVFFSYNVRQLKDPTMCCCYSAAPGLKYADWCFHPSLSCLSSQDKFDCGLIVLHICLSGRPPVLPSFPASAWQFRQPCFTSLCPSIRPSRTGLC